MAAIAISIYEKKRKVLRMRAQHNIHSIRMLEREREHFILLATHNSEFDSTEIMHHTTFEPHVMSKL